MEIITSIFKLETINNTSFAKWPSGIYSLKPTQTAVWRDFDLDGWVDLAIDRFAETEENDGLTIKTANVDADEVRIFDRLFDNVQLNLIG